MQEKLTVQQIQQWIRCLPQRMPFLLAQDLAIIYEDEVKHINQAVKRNPKRFPDDFVFQLTNEEVKILKSQNVTLHSPRANPYGFYREGANMLSAVLRSNVAIQRSVQIMRAFSAMERVLEQAIFEIDKKFEACKHIAETAGLSGNQAVLSASRMVKYLLGYDPLELMGQKQLPNETQQIQLTPTALGKMIEGKSAQKVNQLLEKAGLQESFRDAKNKKCWKPTERGKKFSVLTDTNKKHSDGRPIQQLMWLDSVVSFLKAFEKQTEFAF